MQITDASSPPKPGADIEHLSIDFKRQMQPKPDLREVAKDIAALANALGGVIWIGVDEDKATHRVGSYYPLTPADAERARTLYHEAAMKKCSPSPVIDTIPIAVPGGLVVAVNVWPFPGQAVGIEVAPDGYAFPVRVGTSTTYLMPEQLAMLMVPELRRIAIHLAAISKGDKVVLHDENGRKIDLHFCKVRSMENIAIFDRPPNARSIATGQPLPPLHVPIDLIRSVWREQAGTWRMVVRYTWTVTAATGDIIFSSKP